MDENGTIGIADTEGFQSVNQEQGLSKTSFSGEQSSSGDDRLGIRHWPRLFEYLENHFSFSASLLSIIGYVIIAAFGAMSTLGQYLGYILFLCVIVFIYNLDKKDRKWLYFFMAVTIVLIGFVCIQNWYSLTSLYHTLNKPFEVNVSSPNTVPEVSN